MTFVLPAKAEVGFLSPEIAGEGSKVIMSDGDQVSWNPPPAKPVMPDWSGIKSIARYFNRTGHQVWPAWLYHPSEEPRLVKNADEAAELGVCYREATADERQRYGLKATWDWTEESKWRPQPWSAPKFNPKNLGQGKTLIEGPVNPVIAQNALLEAVIPAVTAAVVRSLKASGPSAPANIDPKDWEAFLAFQAFRKANETVVEALNPEASQHAAESAADEAPESSEAPSLDEVVNALGGEPTRTELEAEAKRKGVKVDGRWSNERLKTEIDKAA